MARTTKIDANKTLVINISSARIVCYHTHLVLYAFATVTLSGSGSPKGSAEDGPDFNQLKNLILLNLYCAVFPRILFYCGKFVFPFLTRYPHGGLYSGN